MSHKEHRDTPASVDIGCRRIDDELIGFSVDPDEVARLDTETSHFTVIGQPRAMRALNMAVKIPAKGYNVFATGPNGTGKRTAINAVLEEHSRTTDHLKDIVALFGFDHPECPAILTLPGGDARVLRDGIEDLLRELKQVVRALLEKQQFKREKDRILLSNEGWENQLVTDFERRLAADGFSVIHAHEDENGQADIYPIIGDEAVSFDDLQRMLTSGELEESEWNRIRERYYHYLDELKSIYQKMYSNREDMERSLDELTIEAARPDIEQAFEPLRRRFPHGPVSEHLDRMCEDVEQHLAFFLPDGPEKDDDGSPPLSRYRVNILVDHANTERVPVIFESNPDYPTLFGHQDPVPEESSEHRSGFMMLRAGSVLQASGGYLVLRAEDILPQEDAWIALKRVLQYNETGIRQAPMPFGQPGMNLKADRIPVDVKVIITGSEYVYEMLYYGDEEIQKLFKIPAEFDTVMPRTDETMQQYLHFMRFIAEEERLAPLTHDAMAAVTEYGIRLSEFRNRLSTRFSMIADLIREAHHFRDTRDTSEPVDRKAGHAAAAIDRGTDTSSAAIDRGAVERAIENRRFLFSLPEEKIDEQIVSRELLLEVTGSAVGRINGLAVIDRGYYAFGRPMLITARSSPGDEGIINIERESGLSGEIHDKGMYILEGFLRSTYARDFPLSLRASIAFEQSYIEVDGDSASSSEAYVLLSSIIELPLRQDLAVTGSMNQMGEIQSVGGISDKIEGFYEVCRKMGFTGTQGVIIPSGNRDNLLLSREVQRALRDRTFHIYSVSTIDEGMEVLTGVAAGQPGRDGSFPRGSINARVSQRLRDMARRMKEYSD